MHSPDNVKKIMWCVVIALMPTWVTAIYFFGFEALVTISVAVASCLFFEWAIQKYLLKQEPTTSDGSAVITGLLLAFNLPSNLPIWMTILGSLVAIGICKMAFGGLGKNPFNPALAARAFLLISFPVAMTTWPNATPLFGNIDALTGPTILAHLSEGIPLVTDNLFDHLFRGSHGGSLGEVSAIAILLGGLFLLWKRIITWHIPVTFMASAFVFVFILCAINPELFKIQLEHNLMNNALSMASVHLLSGGLILGAVFMATDYVTSPMSPKGQLLFGFGCGMLTIVIRVFGAYPEGVSFAILIMNAFVPLIDKGFKPRVFGK
jgi:electron transport complex protein RnfD